MDRRGAGGTRLPSFLFARPGASDAVPCRIDKAHPRAQIGDCILTPPAGRATGARTPGKGKMARSLVITLGLCLLFIVAPLVLAYRTNEVLVVRAERLHVRETPSVDAPSLHLLERGDLLYVLDEEVAYGEWDWLRVFVLYRRDSRDTLDTRLDGWVATRGPGGRVYTQRIERASRKMMALRYMYKWKVHAGARQWVQRSAFLRFIRPVLPLPSDKALHVLLMFFLCSAIFALLLLGLRFGPIVAALLSLFLANGLGILNEVLDLLTGKGAFERMDLAANLVGSVLFLIPWAGWLFLRRARRSLRDRLPR